MNHEEWRPVVWKDGILEPRYEVSSHGRVRSLTRRPRVLALQRHEKGYRMARLFRDDRYWAVQVHVLVLTAFVGPRPNGCHADHRDFDRANNHLGNLRWLPSVENMARTRRRRTPEQKKAMTSARQTAKREARRIAAEAAFEHLAGEAWVPVMWRDGKVEPRYMVSNFGRVRSWKRGGDGRLLTPKPHHKSGHLHVTLSREHEQWFAEIRKLIQRSFAHSACADA